MALHDNIKKAIDEAGLIPAHVAKELGISRATVSDWLSGKTKDIKSHNLIRLAALTNVSAKKLQTGSDDCVKEPVKKYNQPNDKNHTLTPVEFTGRIPVISWTTAGDWHDIVDNLQPYDADEWIPSIGNHSPQTFALRIRGDSMEPTIPNGCTIVVDPAEPADNGRVVVIRQNGDTEATCKRLVIEGGKRYLKPDNPRYPILEMLPDAVICGVAVKIVADL